MRTPEVARQRFEPRYSEGKVTIIDKEGCEERMTIGISLVDLVLSDDRIYNSVSLRKRGFLSQLPLTHCQISQTLDHLHSLYPGLEVYHLGLETPWTKKESV